ncbi:hypothetical protein AVEN_260208-1 [Araneus ventricosus]|uniref:Uncharacterized protein n=1 Tax=Araneus ventricosus TaxID=182803 RepID=A0A4Y2Q1D7_ARAVE|nr:hypothetical protein AVEN_260208-1 [Araneus ventricosus]
MVRKAPMNSFVFTSQSEIEHFECCDGDLITSDVPSDESEVSLIKEKNDLIDDSSPKWKTKVIYLFPRGVADRTPVQVFQYCESKEIRTETYSSEYPPTF